MARTSGLLALAFLVPFGGLVGLLEQQLWVLYVVLCVVLGTGAVVAFHQFGIGCRSRRIAMRALVFVTATFIGDLWEMSLSLSAWSIGARFFGCRNTRA